MYTHEFAVAEAGVQILGEALESCNGGCGDRVRHLYCLPDDYHGCCEGDVGGGAEVVCGVVAKNGEYEGAVQISLACIKRSCGECAGLTGFEARRLR